MLLHEKQANEYEKKLVQVAEMHGELVEFNDRLHKVIVQKESMIQRLRQELVELRGPVCILFLLLLMIDDLYLCSYLKGLK